MTPLGADLLILSDIGRAFGAKQEVNFAFRAEGQTDISMGRSPMSGCNNSQKG
jgi:hypothetical protein